MRTRWSLSALAIALFATAPSAAAACPEAGAIAPRGAFSTAGPTAQAPEGIVRFAEDGAATIMTDAGSDRAFVGLSPDGERLISVSAIRVGAGGPCALTHVWVRSIDLRAGASQRLARLRGGAARSVSFSPSGRFVAIGVDDADNGPRLHVFDLDAGRRRYVIDGVEATWLDEAQFVLRDRRGRISLHTQIDGARVRVLSPPARRLRPYAAGADSSGFWATMRSGRDLHFVRVHLEGTRTRLEERDVALPEMPAAIATDGARGASVVEAAVHVYDLTLGSIIATIHGRPAYDAVALSPDGGTALVISGPVIELVPLDGAPQASWGLPHPPSELRIPDSPALEEAENHAD